MGVGEAGVRHWQGVMGPRYFFAAGLGSTGSSAWAKPLLVPRLKDTKQANNVMIQAT
jgi:hypothetical protein